MRKTPHSPEVEVIPGSEWVSFQVHQQRLRWAALGKQLGERMDQARLRQEGVPQRPRAMLY